jgi:hypothetical protein
VAASLSILPAYGQTGSTSQGREHPYSAGTGSDPSRNNTDPNTAAKKPGSPGSDQTSAGTVGQVGGRVSSVDSSSNSLTLADGSVLKLDPAVNVMKDGQSASVTDIKPGDEIRASYAPNKDSIQRITVTSRGSSK